MQYNPAESVRYLTSIKLIRITTYNPRPINFCCSIEKIQYLCLNKDYNILFKIHQLNQFSKRHMLLATRFL